MITCDITSRILPEQCDPREVHVTRSHRVLLPRAWVLFVHLLLSVLPRMQLPGFFVSYSCPPAQQKWLPQPLSPTQAAWQLHTVSSSLLFFFLVLKCIFTYSLRIPYIYMQRVLIKLTSHSLPYTLALFSLQLCPDKPAGSWQCCKLGEHWIHRPVWPPGLAAQAPWGSHLGWPCDWEVTDVLGLLQH